MGIGALAFIAASVGHEAIGHGGMAWLTGRHITLISSVYFKAQRAGPGTDAAGPLANLVFGALAWVALRYRQPGAPPARLWLAATMALNLFWGAGYFLYTGIAQRGDWVFLFAESGPAARWAWRAGLVAVGLYSYRLAIRVARNELARFADAGCADRPLRRVAVALYLSAGATCCLAALAYRGPVGPALRESMLESFGAFAGLLLAAAARPGPIRRTEGPGPQALARDGRWIGAAAVAFVIYTATMGRGYFG